MPSIYNELTSSATISPDIMELFLMQCQEAENVRILGEAANELSSGSVYY